MKYIGLLSEYNNKPLGVSYHTIIHELLNIN